MVIRFHYIGCGLPDIWLRNGFEIYRTGYGEAVSIRDVEGLHRAIAMELVDNSPRLTSAELRFLRIEMGLSQKRLADLLDVPERFVRRWEDDGDPVAGSADRLIRTVYRESVCGASRVRRVSDHFARLDSDTPGARIEFETCENGWKSAA